MPQSPLSLSTALVASTIGFAAPSAAAQLLHFEAGGPHPASFDIRQ